jgi:SpoVK/Ycf46/Vps4 family AAA+-type ATPase
MTGADFYALASDAYLRAIRRLITNNREDVEENNDQTVTLVKSDFYDALENFTPSLNENEIRQYERLQKS